MRFLRDLFDKFLGLFFPKQEGLNIQVSDAIDLRGLFDEEPQGIEEETLELNDGFKMFSSKDEYNREFLCVFQNFKGSFFLDHTHKDGHFRV